MAVQDVRALVPRVRRAIEGPLPLAGADALNDAQVEALAADCIADIILLTNGAWGHTLTVSEVDEETQVPVHYAVEPELELQEQSVVAAQAAVTYFFHQFRDRKVSERISNEGVEWEWAVSGALLRDHIKALQEQRDAALAAVTASNPAMARYASFLQVRDPVMAAVIEPYVGGVGLGGGQLLLP
jgi:hypothetical protein